MDEPTDEDLDAAFDLDPALLARLTWADAATAAVLPSASPGAYGPADQPQALWCLPRAQRGVDGRLCAWWPRDPSPSGGPVPWLPAGPAQPLRGAKSTKAHVLCVGGPLHRIKLRRSVKTGERSKMKVWPLLEGQPFVVKPYQGHYAYSQEQDRYDWQQH